MRRLLYCGIVLAFTSLRPIVAQEARSGAGLRVTATAQLAASNVLTDAPRNGAPVAPGGRAMLYPTFKFDENLYVTGAMQLVTRPYYFEDFSTRGYGAYGRLLQATLNYSRISRRGLLLLRAGQMSSAFGSFLLRYDDADNALIDLPPAYGYYYAPVSMLGVAGAQVDATHGRLDGRVQFANSSPANPRSIFAPDQYGNWAGGAGFTIRQGLRVGVSGYHGPYLDRKYAFYFPGEAKPSTLPAHGIGLDADWAYGHTKVYVELQRFLMSYKVIPDFRESTGYGEVKQVLGPRWFVAGRYSYACDSARGAANTFESAVGFRPGRSQLIKAGYEEVRHRSPAEPGEHRFAIQFIVMLQRSVSRNQAR
jgi:hypothetical protein